MIYATTYSILHQPLDQWFPKWAVGGAVKQKWAIGGGEVEMGRWGAIGNLVINYISVVLLTLSDQMS